MKVSLMCQLWSVFPNVQCMHIALVLTVPIASDSVFSLTTITQKAEYGFKVSVSAAEQRSDSKRSVRFCLEAKLPLQSPHHSDCSPCRSLRVDLQSLFILHSSSSHHSPLIPYSHLYCSSILRLRPSQSLS